MRLRSGKVTVKCKYYIICWLSAIKSVNSIKNVQMFLKKLQQTLSFSSHCVTVVVLRSADEPICDWHRCWELNSLRCSHMHSQLDGHVDLCRVLPSHELLNPAWKTAGKPLTRRRKKSRRKKNDEYSANLAQCSEYRRQFNRGLWPVLYTSALI